MIFSSVAVINLEIYYSCLKLNSSLKVGGGGQRSRLCIGWIHHCPRNSRLTRFYIETCMYPCLPSSFQIFFWQIFDCYWSRLDSSGFPLCRSLVFKWWRGRTAKRTTWLFNIAISLFFTQVAIFSSQKWRKNSNLFKESPFIPTNISWVDVVVDAVRNV